MNAKIKIKYAEAKKNETYRIVEIQDRRVTLDINGRKVDFGFSEVQIVAPNDNELFNFGSYILHKSEKSLAGLRESDVSTLINNTCLPASKNLMRKAVNTAIWGC